MQVFDASSMIYAWDNYPIRAVSGALAWMAVIVAQGDTDVRGRRWEVGTHKMRVRDFPAGGFGPAKRCP